MQKIIIKKKILKTKGEEQALYYVPALSLKNSDNKIKLFVPHPNGNDVMEFSTVEEAAAAIKKAGFEYQLPNGEIVEEQKIQPMLKSHQKGDIEKCLFNKYKSKINNLNSAVAASSITAMSYLNDSDAIDIFISKLGEENEKIRTAAIDALVSCQSFAVNKLIDTLSSPNWVARNSAITCLVKISEYSDVIPENLLVPIINRIDDENTIVQANAILASGIIYKNMQKRQEIH